MSKLVEAMSDKAKVFLAVERMAFALYVASLLNYERGESGLTSPLRTPTESEVDMYRPSWTALRKSEKLMWQQLAQNVLSGKVDFRKAEDQS